MNGRILAVAALVALAGCGGGSGGGSTPTVPVQATPTTAPGSTVPSAQLVVTFPAGTKGGSSSARAPQYVSPNATKIVVIVNTVNGTTPPSYVPGTTTTNFDFTPGTGNCTSSGGTATCTIAIPAPPGSVNYTFNVEDNANDVLSTSTTTLTIHQGTTNALTVTLQGVVATVTVAGATLAANDTSHATTGETLTVSAFDASGAQIVNGTSTANYAHPITLTDNDASGQTKLSVNGGTAANSVTVNAPADVVTLVYTGQAVNNFTVTATGTGITGGGSITASVNDVTFTGTTDDDAAHGGLVGDANYGAQTLFFATSSGSQNVTGAELGFTNSPFSKQFDLDVSACTGIATASASPATSFTITATGVGVCAARMKEHGTGYPLTNHTANVTGNETHNGTFYISVTTSAVTVNGHHR